MNGTDTQREQIEDVIEDEEINVPEAHVFETIPPGTYIAKLVSFRTVDKPAWKLTGAEGEDKMQYEWRFLITEGEYAGIKLTDYTNRTFHEKAKAHKHAAALLGVPSLTPGVNRSTRELAGKSAQVWVTEVESKKEPGTYRNYVDKLLPLPAARQRRNAIDTGSGNAASPSPADQKRQREAVPRRQLPGYPTDQDGDEDDPVKQF